MSLNFRTPALAVTAAAALLWAAAAVPAAARTAVPVLPAPLPVAALTVGLVPPPGPLAALPVVPSTHCVLTLHRADAPTARCGAAALTRAARTGTLLMTWYRDAGYTGDNTDLRSDDGPCPAAGAGVSDLGGDLGPGWSAAISSFRVFGGCAVVEGFAADRYEGESRIWVGDQPYVGDDWNDRIASLVVRG